MARWVQGVYLVPLAQLDEEAGEVSEVQPVLQGLMESLDHLVEEECPELMALRDQRVRMETEDSQVQQARRAKWDSLDDLVLLVFKVSGELQEGLDPEVNQERGDLVVSLELMARMAKLVLRVSKVCLVQWDNQETRVFQERRVRKVILAQQETQDLEETQELMEPLVLLAHQVPLDQWEEEDHQDPLEQEVSRECLVPLAKQDRLVKMERLVYQAGLV